MSRPAAILIVGPTGAGKTPLGTLLQREGLWNKRCHHFDFGDSLRRIVDAESPPDGFGPGEVGLLREVLDSGGLLEDGHFHVAEKVLLRFIERRHVGEDSFVVLNGLPRHVGQARDVVRIVDLVAVIQLRCGSQVVLERVRTGAGGDRCERSDDDVASVLGKLRTFARRTVPLLNHYRSRNVPVHIVEVTLTTTPEHICRRLHTPGGREPDPER